MELIEDLKSNPIFARNYCDMFAFMMITCSITMDIQITENVEYEILLHANDFLFCVLFLTNSLKTLLFLRLSSSEDSENPTQTILRSKFSKVHTLSNSFEWTDRNKEKLSTVYIQCTLYNHMYKMCVLIYNKAVCCTMHMLHTVKIVQN